MLFWYRLNVMVAVDNVDAGQMPRVEDDTRTSERMKREPAVSGSRQKKKKKFAVSLEELLNSEQFRLQAHKLAWIRQRISRC